MPRHKIPIWAILFLLCSGASFAETITLKSGITFEGDIIERGEDYIKVDIGIGIPMTYYLDQLEDSLSASLKNTALEEAAKNELIDFYKKQDRAFELAISNKDLSFLKPYLRDAQMKAMEQLTNKDQLFEFLKMTRENVPAEENIIAKYIEGRRGVVIAEGFKHPPVKPAGASTGKSAPRGYKVLDKKPVKERVYGIHLFEKNGNNWKVVSSERLAYNDPRPYFTALNGRDHKYAGLQYHCNFTKKPAQCEDSSKHPVKDLCYECLAQLTSDKALCKMVSKDLEEDGGGFFTEQIARNRQACYYKLAKLTGDPDICQNLDETTPSTGRTKKDCLEKLKYHDWISSHNVLSLDSDGDGLSDRLELYFNTSAAQSDTDGDGVSDKTEIDNFDNPLGQGRLGDHLGY